MINTHYEVSAYIYIFLKHNEKVLKKKLHGIKEKINEF